MSYPAKQATSTVIVQPLDEAIVRIILNRPHRLNALNVDLLGDLASALREHSHARVIILEGAGDRAFCAGEDLKETLMPQTGGAAEMRDALNKLQDLTRLTASSSAIIIAAVQGYAVGGGAEIALAADFVIGGPNARFQFPEAVIGHAVTNGISVRLVQLVGLLKAKELLLTGRFCDAQEALKIGLLSELAANPKERAIELARTLAKQPHISMTASKTSLERAAFPNMETCLHDEVNVASYCFAQTDALDAFSNFAARKDSSIESGISKRTESRSKSNDLKVDSILVKTTSQHPPIRDLNSAWVFAVQHYPTRVFLRCEGQDLTFADFEVRVAKLAGGLQHLDIRADDRVLAMVQNSIDLVCIWLAVNRLGAIWAPINTALRSKTLAHVIEAAQPKLVIVDQELHAELEALNVIDPDRIWIRGSDSPRDLSHLYSLSSPVTEAVFVSPATTSAFLYTSGTTGRSKPCVISHEYFLIGAKTLIAACGLRQSDVLFCPFPLCHADATVFTVVPAILLGATAAIAPRFSVSRFWDEIRLTQATVYSFMGATLALTYKRRPSSRDREHHVRLAWGVPMPNFARGYEARFGHALITLYGSVEANVPIIQDVTRPLPEGSCGRVQPGYQVRIGNRSDEEVAPNTPGQILVRCDVPTAVFGGYYQNETSTLATLGNMWLHTGDIGKLDGDGNVYFLGRLKDIVRRRGENINASEVESEFLEHPDVIIAAAYGIPSALGHGTEEDLKIAVKIREHSTVSETELWEWARTRLTRFQIPDVIQIVQSIPRTQTGKIEKHLLTHEGGSRFSMAKL